jgi:hypothetical protein
LDSRLAKLLEEEVERQCRFGLMAADDLQSALAAGESDNLRYAVQALLIAAGNVSKVLWPVKPASSARGEHLRRTLEVADDSPLANRDLRNHFEHFDERLEDWATSSARHNFVDSCIGNLKKMMGGVDATDCLRNLDPATMCLTFGGEVTICVRS